MNPSKLSKPVIAGITVGVIVACTLVILLILKLTGFFEPKETVDEPDTKGKPSESYQKGINLMPFGEEEDLKLLEKWIADELPEIVKKEPAALEPLLDALTTCEVFRWLEQYPQKYVFIPFHFPGS